MYRLTLRWLCTSVTVSVVTGESQVSSRASSESLPNAPVRQAVRSDPSTAKNGLSPGV